MADLALVRADLMNDVAHFLGWQRVSDPESEAGSGTWTSDEITVIKLCVQGGLRWFYYPPPTAEGEEPYVWSFMRKVYSISTSEGDDEYDMPTDFSGRADGFVATLEQEHPLRVVNYSRIKALQTNNAKSGAPHYIAFRPEATTADTTVEHDSTKQRWECVLYPTPDNKDYAIICQYVIDPDEIESTEYPIGGTAHAETVRAACLAYAEWDKDKLHGVAYQEFLLRLKASIAIDRQSLGMRDEPTFPVGETAPTNLNVTYQVLARWAARVMGWDDDENTWSFTQAKQVDEIIQEGLRRFYYPQPVGEGGPSHQWSFLLINASLDIGDESYQGNYEYELAADTDGTILQVQRSTGDYAGPLSPISYEQLCAWRSKGDTAAGVPRWYAVYPKTEAHTTTVQKWYMAFCPSPDVEYTVLYRYRTCPAPLTATNCYPLGTGAHGSTILSSVCAVAEEVKGVLDGPWRTRFLAQLAGSIESDKLSAPLQTGPTWPVGETAPTDLGINYAILTRGIANVLGYGRGPQEWTKVQELHIEEVLHNGLRQFYYPPVLPGRRKAHEWTFLKPVTTLTAWADVAADSTITGTGVHSAGYTTFTASEASFYASMVNASVTITDVSGTFPIYSYTSSTVVVLTGNATCADKTFAVACESVFALPSAFGGLIGDITFDASEACYPLQLVSEAQIRKLQQQTAYTGRPRFGAIRPRSSTGSAVQQFELIVYPEPDQNYTLHYRYFVRPRRLTSTNPYPYGGPEHAETILQACLAAAECDKGGRGIHYEKFLERLTASVSVDESAMTPDFLGVNADHSDERDSWQPVRHSNVTYNSVEYP